MTTCAILSNYRCIPSVRGLRSDAGVGASKNALNLERWCATAPRPSPCPRRSTTGRRLSLREPSVANQLPTDYGGCSPRRPSTDAALDAADRPGSTGAAGRRGRGSRPAALAVLRLVDRPMRRRRVAISHPHPGDPVRPRPGGGAIRARTRKGKHFSIVAVAEGAQSDAKTPPEGAWCARRSAPPSARTRSRRPSTRSSRPASRNHISHTIRPHAAAWSSPRDRSHA